MDTERLEIKKAIERFSDLLENLSTYTDLDIDQIKKDIQSFLLTSIFKGEYYLKECLNATQLNNTQISLNDRDKIVYLKDLINNYTYLCQYIQDKCKGNHNKLYFNFHLEENLHYKRGNSIDFLISSAINLSTIDEGYSTEKSYVSILSRLHYDLTRVLREESFELDYKIFFEYLLFKCSLLLYKLIKRKEKNKISYSDNTPNLDFFVFKDSTISDLSKEIEDYENFDGKEIIKQINDVYFLEDVQSIEKFTEKIKNIINSEDQAVKIKDSHFFSKYVKRYLKFCLEKGVELDVNLKREIDYRLNSLKILYRNKIINCKSDIYFDGAKLIPYQSIYKLIINTEFRFYAIPKIIRLRNSDSNVKDIELIFNEIKEYYERNHKDKIIAIDSNLSNFSYHIIYFKVLIELLKICKNNSKRYIDSDYSFFEKIINEMLIEARNSLLLYERGVHKDKENELMPLYIEIEECINKNPFIDSQYILPSDYQFLLKKHTYYLELLYDLERIKFLLISPEMKGFVKESLEKEFQKNQYNIITVIGLYASFITFILSSFSQASNNKIFESPKSVMFSIFVLGIVIFYFVASLKVLFSYKQRVIFFSKGGKSYGLSTYFLYFLGTIILLLIGYFVYSKINI